jgi:hypothetical protein
MNTYEVVYFPLDSKKYEIFECKADNEQHAQEQCLNAYPDCTITSIEEV